MPDTKMTLNLWSSEKVVGWTPSENQTVLEPKLLLMPETKVKI